MDKWIESLGNGYNVRCKAWVKVLDTGNEDVACQTVEEILTEYDDVKVVKIKASKKDGIITVEAICEVYVCSHNEEYATCEAEKFLEDVFDGCGVALESVDGYDLQFIEEAVYMIHGE